MSQKQELGKGLKALLSNINKENTTVYDQTLKTESINAVNAQTLSITLVKPNPNQPRNHFDEEKLNELTESIKHLGIIQPITVRKNSESEYLIISGERRFKAAQKANLKEIPVYIRTANDQELLEMALIENIQREDLNPIEIAISYQMLMDEFNLTHEAMADRVGKKRSTISNYTRLLKLPPDIQAAVKTNQLSMGHARVIAGVDNLLQQMHLFKEIQQHGLSVRASEEMLNALQRKNSRKIVSENKIDSSDNEIKLIENKFAAFFGAKTIISRKKDGSGQLVIRFKSDDALNDLLDRID